MTCRAWCPTCHTYHESEIPGALPRYAFSNSLIAQALVDHFGGGIPMGHLARRLDVKESALTQMSHRIADLLKDGELKGYFELTDRKRDRFFQWVGHSEVEAENNLAERRLRPLVVARKVCFGSQSEKGLQTRETLMSVIDTLKQRNEDAVAKLISVLDAIAKNAKVDVAKLLWQKP